jgi:two-component system chemotaxis response regulator CheB
MTALRVLICEDSFVYATALRRVLEHDGDISVAATCATAEAALAALARIQPDLVTMDINLPGLDGIQAVAEIMSLRPLPILVLSTLVGPSSDRAAAALAAGALDAQSKDGLDLRDPAGAPGAALRRRVRLLSRVRVIRHPRARLAGQPGTSGPRRPASVIGLCASTGGPQVLVRLLDGLPADYPIPILIVQHIGAGFTEGLARWLDQAVALPVGIAVDGARTGPGAWIAPEGAHLKLSATGRLSLDRLSVPGRYRPSGDVLLSSLAAVAGNAGVAVVLSGMGSDGAVGAAALQSRRGLAIAQDEESSVVFGMPKAAIDRGVGLVLSPGRIVARLLALRYEPLNGTR